MWLAPGVLVRPAARRDRPTLEGAPLCVVGIRVWRTATTAAASARGDLSVRPTSGGLRTAAPQSSVLNASPGSSCERRHTAGVSALTVDRPSAVHTRRTGLNRAPTRSPDVPRRLRSPCWRPAPRRADSRCGRAGVGHADRRRGVGGVGQRATAHASDGSTVDEDGNTALESSAGAGEYIVQLERVPTSTTWSPTSRATGSRSRARWRARSTCSPRRWTPTRWPSFAAGTTWCGSSATSDTS